MKKKGVRKRKRSVTLPTEPTIMAMSPKDHIMLFYGPPGVGKTTFVNSLGMTVLFLSTDRGTRSQRALRVECHTFEDFVAALDALKADASAYDIVCIDHIDSFCGMAEEWTCKELGIDHLGDAGYGKGWKAYRTAIENYVQALMRLDVGLVFIAHEDIKTVRTRAIELERTMPALSKGAWKTLIPLADIVGYCGFTTQKRAGKKVEVRTLETDPREDLYAKDRTRRSRSAGSYEDLDGPKFVASFTEKKAHGRKKKVGRRAAR